MLDMFYSLSLSRVEADNEIFLLCPESCMLLLKDLTIRNNPAILTICEQVVLCILLCL